MAFTEFTPKEYLQLDIANGYGLDKINFDKRLEWFEQNRHHLHKMTPSAKNPAHFYAAVTSLEAAERGEPIGHLISWDATASGLQILSAMTCDPKAAQLCNVIDSGNRENAYELIHRDLQQRVGETVTLDPEVVKKAVMTSFYGSKAQPRKAFGEELLPLYHATLEELAIGPWQLNLAFLDMWNSSADTYGWVMPDGFTVKVKVKKTLFEDVSFLGMNFLLKREVHEATEEGRSICANATHSTDALLVRELSRRANYEPASVARVRTALAEGLGTSIKRPKDIELIRLLNLAQGSGFLSARVLDYIDNDNVGHVKRSQVTALLDTLAPKPFQVLTNHDCFRCHPNYGNALRRLYNQLLHELAKADVAGHIATQLTGIPVDTVKIDPAMADRILDANYALS